MREVTELHQLKALPLCVCVRTTNGSFRSRDESGSWSEIGTPNSVAWSESDFPAKVVWSYAEEINAPEVEALARMASVMIQQQARAQVIQEAQAAQVQQQFQQAQANGQAAQANGEAPPDAPPEQVEPEERQDPEQVSG
jgi:hypothetical protein